MKPSRFILPRPPPLGSCRCIRRNASRLSARHSQIMRLPDGRTLGFAEHGRSTDYPLLFIHGYPTSRLETFGIDETAQRHNIRIITPDRNGYGLTTFDQARRILDWPTDVQSLAQHLGLKRFAILGASGGSPYALACAYRLPPEMLSAVGIMAGAGPWEAGDHYMSLPYRLSAFAAHRWPSGYGGILNLFLWALRRMLDSRSGVTRINKWLDSNTDVLESKKDVDERRELLALQVFEAFRQGVDPAVHDARLLTSDWGIQFEDVTYNKVKIWHGAKDANAPIELIRYMARRLPHCKLTEFPEDTHFTLNRHLDQILSQLILE